MFLKTLLCTMQTPFHNVANFISGWYHKRQVFAHWTFEQLYRSTIMYNFYYCVTGEWILILFYDRSRTWYMFILLDIKVQLFWEGHKNLRNLPHGFDIYLVNVKTIRQIVQFFVALPEKLNFNGLIVICPIHFVNDNCQVEQN